MASDNRGFIKNFCLFLQNSRHRPHGAWRVHGRSPRLFGRSEKAATDLRDHRFEHGFGQAASIHIVARAVIARTKGTAIAKVMDGAVHEGVGFGLEAEGAQGRGMRDAAECHDDAWGGRGFELALQEGSAAVDLGADRLVGGRDTADRIGDPAVDQAKAIIRLGTEMSFGEPVTDEGRVEQVAGIIAGERSPCSIGATQAWRQADDQQTRIQGPEGRDRCVVPCRIRSSIVVPKGDQARAERT